MLYDDLKFQSKSLTELGNVFHVSYEYTINEK